MNIFFPQKVSGFLRFTVCSFESTEKMLFGADVLSKVTISSILQSNLNEIQLKISLKPHL